MPYTFFVQMTCFISVFSGGVFFLVSFWKSKKLIIFTLITQNELAKEILIHMKKQMLQMIRYIFAYMSEVFTRFLWLELIKDLHEAVPP